MSGATHSASRAGRRGRAVGIAVDVVRFDDDLRLPAVADRQDQDFIAADLKSIG